MSRLALFVGNSRYDDAKLAQLKTPAADVRRLASAIRDPAIGGFDEVVELIDETEAAIRRHISAFFDRRKSDDLLLCYFSGHGVRDDRGRLFLAARDTSLTQLKATAIPSSYLVEHMDECRSRRQILILDCCNSGAFAHGTKGDPTAMTRATFEGNGYGRVVLTASDATQYAFEGDHVIARTELSLFTHYLFEGLTTGAAAPPGETQVTLDQWYDYAYSRVLEQTRTQTPRKWVYNQEGALVIARNPHPRPVPGLPKAVQDAGQDERPEVRRGAVTELLKIARTSDGRYQRAAIAALEVLAAGDRNDAVRESATAALGGLGSTRQGSGKAAEPAVADPAGPTTAAPEQASPADRLGQAPSAPSVDAAPAAAPGDRYPVLWWIGANALGEGAATWYYAIIRRLQVSQDLSWIVNLGAGALTGAILWRAIRHWGHRPTPLVWLVAMAVSEIVVRLASLSGGLLFGNDLDRSIAFPIRGVLMGVGFGVVQAIVLKRWLPDVRVWVGATTAAMVAGQFLLLAAPPRTEPAAVVAAIVRGAIVGAATVWLVRRHFLRSPIREAV